MTDLSGKLALVVGVANKRSIAWAIAQALAASGARLALTYPSERLEENVRELAATLDNPADLPCDVSSDEQIAELGPSLDKEFGGLDFLVHGAAFAKAEDLAAPFSQTSREGFRIALDISAYSFIALARQMRPLMQKRGGGSMLDADLPRQRTGVQELQRDGRGEGCARSVRPISRRRAWTREHPRQRHFGRTDQDARGDGHFRASRASSAHYREQAPLHKNTDSPKSPTPRCSCSARPAGASRRRS